MKTEDIKRFYRNQEPDISNANVNWRIHNLKKQGIINRIGTGKYHLSTEKIFQPEISTKIKLINRRLKRQFPFLKICIWNTSAINEFMHHQPGKYYTLIEVEKKSAEAVFYYLKEKSEEVYLEPSEDTMHKYISTSNNPLIVKTLVTESPIQNAEGVDTITIEKMLVDIYCDTIIFTSQQGSELANIFRDAIEKYTVNENRMLRYANRRRGKSEINNFLNMVSGYMKSSERVRR